MNKFKSIRLAMLSRAQRIAMAALAVVSAIGTAVAEDTPSAAEQMIASAQSDLEGIVEKVATAGAAILLVCLGLKLLPFAYRKISGFFK